MNSANPKGPLGQPLSFGELISLRAREEDVRQTISFLMEQAHTYVRRTFPNAVVHAYQDAESFGWVVKIEIPAEDKWGKRKKFGISQMISDEELQRRRRYEPPTGGLLPGEGFAHFIELFIYQMVQFLKRDLERESCVHWRGTQDRIRPYVKPYKDEAFKEDLSPYYWEDRHIFDDEVKRAIESIKKRADLD